MTTLSCGSCGAELKVDPEKLAGRTSARCARCKATIDLTGVLLSSPTVEAPRSVVTCGSCGARLKLPAGASFSRARCPKCRGEISLAETRTAETSNVTGPPLAARQSMGMAATSHDDSSGATRRLDSRALGIQIAAMSGPVSGSEAPTTSLASGNEPIAPGDLADPRTEPSPATRLLRPPIKALKGAAEQIREAAQEFGQVRSTLPPEPHAPVVNESVSATAVQDVAEPTQTAVAKRRSLPTVKSAAREAARRRDAQPFPAVRGLVSGLVAGSVTGGAWLAVLKFAPAAALQPFVAPVPSFPGIPTEFARVAVEAMLGALAGFLAAAAKSPKWGDRPLRLRRSLPSALLIGLVAGLSISFFSQAADGGSLIWPAVHWLRDLLLIGLLTPAVNRLIRVQPA